MFPKLRIGAHIDHDVPIFCHTAFRSRVMPYIERNKINKDVFFMCFMKLWHCWQLHNNDIFVDLTKRTVVNLILQQMLGLSVVLTWPLQQVLTVINFYQTDNWGIELTCNTLIIFIDKILIVHYIYIHYTFTKSNPVIVQAKLLNCLIQELCWL